MAYAEANGERLYYEISGEGPPLVMIRGLSRSMRFWEPLLPHLAGRFQLFLYDHRGIGRSEIQKKRFTVADMADDLAALLEVTGFGRAHVFGLSLGGMVAQHLALRHPHLVDRLLLGSTTPGGLKGSFPRVDTLLKLALLSAALPVDLSARLQGPLLVSPGYHRLNPETAKSWASHLALEPLDGQVVLFQALGGALHNVWRELGKIEAETLVLHGDRDRLIHHRNGEVLAATIPRATLRLLSGRGHDIVAESPAEVASHFRQFLLGSAA